MRMYDRIINKTLGTAGSRHRRGGAERLVINDIHVSSVYLMKCYVSDTTKSGCTQSAVHSSTLIIRDSELITVSAIKSVTFPHV